MPLRPRGAQALTSGCLGSRTARHSGSLSRLGACSLRSPRTVHPFARKGRLFGTSTLPLGRPLSPSVLHLRITALSVPLSSTSPQACQSLSRPPLHRPVSPSLVHLFTGLSVPLSSTSPQTCQSLSRPPLHRSVSPSLDHLPLHRPISPLLVHISTPLHTRCTCHCIWIGVVLLETPYHYIQSSVGLLPVLIRALSSQFCHPKTCQF